VTRAWTLAAICGGVMVAAGPARAGGYDTPMLYSARHMGMGGTAIGFVEDPSAMFHNPAGLGNIKKFSVLGDFSLLLAHVTASPDLSARDTESELTKAPLFLLGGGLRLTDWLVAGLGVYPIASAGATYEYTVPPSNQVENTTRLVFIEASPGLAFNLPHSVRLGAGYRLTYVNLERYFGNRAFPGGTHDFKLDGFNLFGFRVGAQWTPLPWLALGAVYRHQVETTVKHDTGIAAALPFTEVETKFLLPSKLGAGGRVDIGDFGFAVDGEYLFNSQNEGSPLSGVLRPPRPTRCRPGSRCPTCSTGPTRSRFAPGWSSGSWRAWTIASGWRPAWATCSTARPRTSVTRRPSGRLRGRRT
jgi:long-subunit fatty acid transport protein